MNQEFIKLMSTRFLFTFAVQMQAVVLAWRMYDLTHNPLSLGLIGLAEALPAIGLALFAGIIVDKGNPVAIYKKTVLLSLFSAAILLVSQISGSDSSLYSLSPQGQIFALYLSSFLTGFARSFFQPVFFALVPRIVPRDQLSQASAWMSSSMQVARIAGPALGGIFFAWIGIIYTSLCVCLVLLMALLAATMVTVHIEIKHQQSPAASPSLKAEILSGVDFVLRHPILFPSLTLDMISVLFGGVTALLPIYAAEILFIGPKGLGVLRAAPAIGAALMSVWLLKINFRQHAGLWFLSAVMGFGLCILGFGIGTNFYLAAFILGLSGALDSISMVIRTAAVQLCSPDHMRGRISAVNSIFIGSSNEIGEFESGIAANLMGTVNSVIFGGCMCLATVVFMGLRYPKLRQLNLDELEHKH